MRIKNYDQFFLYLEKEFNFRLEEIIACHWSKAITLLGPDEPSRESIYELVLKPVFGNEINSRSEIKTNFVSGRTDFNWYMDVFMYFHSKYGEPEEKQVFLIDSKIIKSMLLESKTLRNHIANDKDAKSFYFERLVDNMLFILDKTLNIDKSPLQWKDYNFKQGLEKIREALKFANLTHSIRFDEMYGLESGISFPSTMDSKIKQIVKNYLEGEEVTIVETINEGDGEDWSIEINEEEEEEEEGSISEEKNKESKKQSVEEMLDGDSDYFN